MVFFSDSVVPTDQDPYGEPFGQSNHLTNSSTADNDDDLLYACASLS